MNKLFVVMCPGRFPDTFFKVENADKALQAFWQGVSEGLQEELQANPAFTVKELTLEQFLELVPTEFMLQTDTSF